MGPSLQQDGVFRQDSDVPFHCTIDLHASVRQPVLDLEAEGPRRRRRSQCFRHLSEVVRVEARLPDLGTHPGRNESSRDRRETSLERGALGEAGSIISAFSSILRFASQQSGRI